MKIGFCLTDIQDYHLYGYLIDYYISKSHNITIFYDNTVKKTTSPCRNMDMVKQFSCQYSHYKDANHCNKLVSDYDILITNEGMPFKSRINIFPDLYALSWATEYYVHGPRYLNMCKYFFCDCSKDALKDTFDFNKYSTKVIYGCHPKYYILHNKNKNDVCRELDLDSDKRYVTVFGPAPAQNWLAKSKDIIKLVKEIKKRGYFIIYKQKPKSKDVSVCYYDQKMLHKHKKYSTSLMLTYISDFTIGFNTSAVVESVRTATPFINLYLDHNVVNYRVHPVSKIHYDRILRLEYFDKKQIHQFIDNYCNSEKNIDYSIAKELNI